MTMTTTLEKPLQIPASKISDAHLRPACSDVVYVRGVRVDVPAGFQLAKGPVQIGDKYLSYPTFLRSRCTEILWIPADKFVDQKIIADVEPDHAADAFAMLIRPVATPEECPGNA